MEVNCNPLHLTCNNAISWYRRKEILVCVYVDVEGLRALVYTGEGSGGVELTYQQQYTGATSEEPWYFAEENLQRGLQELVQKLTTEGYEKDKLIWLFVTDGCAYKESLELPVLTQTELEEALAWEVPQRIPWEEDSYVYRYTLKQATQTKNESKELAPVQEICVYAVPKQCVTAITKVSQSLGLTLTRLTVAEALDLENDEQTVNMQELEFYEGFYTEAQLENLRQEFAQPLLLVILFVKNELTLNFLPATEQFQAILQQTRSLCQWLSSFIFVVSLCLGGGCLFLRSHLEQQALAQQEKFVQLSLWEARRQELQSLQAENQRLTGKLQSLGENKIFWSKYLWGLGRVMPQGCWLTRVEAQELEDAGKKRRQRLVLMGKAANMELVSQLVENLQKQEGYVKVELEDADLKSNSKRLRGFLDFRIQAELKMQTRDAKQQNNLKANVKKNSSEQEKGSAKNA